MSDLFEVRRCVECGKLRLVTTRAMSKSGAGCPKCGATTMRGAGRFSLIERLKLGWWCVVENWCDQKRLSPANVARAFRMGLNAVAK